MNSNKKMDEHVNNKNELKNLIMIFWKMKYSILGITIVFAILAGIISVFFISPVYNTKVTLVIDMPQNYRTSYGDYTLPLLTNEEYFQLITSDDVLLRTIKEMQYSNKMTITELRSKVSLDVRKKDSTTFIAEVSGKTPEESLRLAKSLYNNYINFLDRMVKERIVNYYYNNYSVELITLDTSLAKEEETLKKNQELLTQITKEYKTTNLEVINYLGKDGNYILPEDTINPNYIKVEADIIDNQQKINELTNSISITKKYLVQLEEERVAIENYYKTDKESDFKINMVSIVDSNIYMPSSLTAPTQKASPSTTRNILLGALLGGMIGVSITFFRAYWKNEF
ncbi:MAG TPA: hypothetical protein DHW61_03715 [Lachnoclostridium phytofermentans]|uniref:Polysaccharide chain length determinant N-terminal domain-containing protein n=1 Tax=Lachnoclostridium phytofermentans TaxID=66219 RepID=A0A3D2X4E3_9FIRM|nr:Wzz/FepE/Etk N-terminal domain-containing protein [Lachnoclostridium sp.]HCL01513.1 hypothetical protein [Lachnoclostridium phytofermentans]